MYEPDSDMFNTIRDYVKDWFGPADARTVTHILRSKRVYAWEVLRAYLDSVKNRNRPTRIPLGIIVLMEEKFMLRIFPPTQLPPVFWG